jgi:hypothetical protein
MRRNLWLVLVMALVLGFPWLASSVASNLETTTAPSARLVPPNSTPASTSSLPAYEGGTPNLQLDLVIVAAAFLVIAYLGWRRGPRRGSADRLNPLDPLSMTLALCTLLALYGIIDSVRIGLPTISGSSLSLSFIPVVAILVVMFVAGFMILGRSGGRLRSAPWQPPSVATGEERQEFASVLERASQSLKAGDEPRSVIIECYRALCEVLQKRGAVNNPSMTAREFEGASQGRLAIRPDLLHRFTALFEKARYSNEEIFAEEASESESMLDVLKSEVERVSDAR